MMGEVVTLNHRVQLAVGTVSRIIEDRALLNLHAREVGKHDGHLRIRVDTLLTRPEMEQARKLIKEVAAHYPRVNIENGEWSNRWFVRKKGLIIKLYFEPAAAPPTNVFAVPEWYKRANPMPPLRPKKDKA